MTFKNKGKIIDIDNRPKRLKAAITLVERYRIDFSKNCGYSDNFVYALITGRRVITLEIAKHICETYPEIDYIWLITGLKT
jgi:hypothetical protein